MEKTCLLVILAAASAVAFSPQQYYFDERCSGLAASLSVANAIRLRLTHYTGTSLNRNWNCALTLRATGPSDRLMLYFRDLNTLFSSSCRANRLQILDTNGNPLTGPTGLCGSITPSTVYSTSGNSAVVRFTTDSSYQHGDFDILITTFHYGVNSSSCPYASDFLCNNGRCIWSGLTCDGYNNCGDNSDERHGCSLAGGVVAGIALSALFFCGFVCVVLFVFRRRRRNYVRIETRGPGYSTVSSSTTSYPPPQGPYSNPQGSYPQGPTYQK